MSRPRSRRTILSVALLAGLHLGASGTVDLRTAFPYRAVIEVPGTGLCRLELSPEVLKHCRADLSDLRIVDDATPKPPFALDSGPAPDTRIEIQKTEHGEPMEVHQQRIHRDDGPTLWWEQYTLRIPALPDDGAWRLEIVTSRTSFVRRAVVTVRTADGRVKPVVDGGSLFRLPSVEAERTSVDLPRVDDATVELTLEGEDGPFLEPSFRFTVVRWIGPGTEAEVPLEVLSIDHLPQQTVVRLRRPRGIVPAAIRLATTTPSFSRLVEVKDAGSGARRPPLGRSRLTRVDGVVPAEVMEMSLGSATGDTLEVAIHDFDSPALTDLEFTALVRRPALLFSIPPTADHAVLLFGGGRTDRSTYDLAHLVPAAGEYLTPSEADSRLAFVDPAAAQFSRIGPVESNPLYRPAAALDFARRPGATLDPSPYSHVRLLEVTPSQAGLAHLRLRPEDLAVARPDLADLRVVDGTDHQWAYLVETAQVFEEVPLELVSRRTERGTTRWRLRPEEGPVPADQLVFEVDTSFFDRSYRLTGRTPSGDHMTLSAGRLARAHGTGDPLVIPFTRRRLQSLELAIEDGGDAPLVPTRLALRVPAPVLYFPAEQGNYRLLLGNPTTEPPRYELERVRQVVLAAASTEVIAGPLEANSQSGPVARFLTRVRGPRLLLWVVIAVAMIVLSLLTLRLARTNPTDE